MIELEPLLPEHHQFVYRLAITGVNAVRWRYRGQIPPYEIFLQQLHQDVLMQFVVQDLQQRELAGHVVAYNVDYRNRMCYVGAIISERYIGTGLGAEALAALVSKVFDLWDFRKVYAEVPEFTLESMRPKMDALSRSNTLFEIEGCLKDYFYSGGRYWDMYQVAVTRQAWHSTVGPS